MPLYIVRWANISASLIQADDDDHLQELLDEEGDPGSAIWEEYDGPVWIEFDPKRRETKDHGFEIDTDSFSADTSPSEFLRPGVAQTDTCFAMYRAILRQLFPHLHRALRETAGSDLSDERARELIVEALAREEWHGDACEERWQRYAGQTNLMSAAGLSVLPKHIARTVLSALEDAKDEGRDITDDLMVMAAQQQDDIAWHEAQRDRLEAERERAREGLADDDDDDEW